MSKVIAVFGSSAPQPGSFDYEQARQVGSLLAEAGCAVATGGYAGTMSAVSQGAATVGGHVIGVTCDQIESYRPIGANQWVKEEIRFATLQERVMYLVKENAGMIVLPGGIGTLSELTLAWSFLQVGEISPRPLVLLGSLWQETMDVFCRAEYVRQENIDALRFAQTPQEAVQQVLKHD